MALRGFEIASWVRASPAAVWTRISTIDGINHELRPLATMTCPPEFAALDPARVPLGERLFRSWVLLFGLLPVEYDDLTLVRIEPGRGFLESSRMFTQRRWIHERTLEAVDGGCRVTDRIQFEPRLPLGGRAFLALFRFFFRHRHRRLVRWFSTEGR